MGTRQYGAIETVGGSDSPAEQARNGSHLALGEPAVNGFRPILAADLLAEQPEPIPWVWDPLLAGGDLAIFSARPKVGKSTLAYALLISIAQGIPFLGYPTRQGPVLILALEEHRRNVRRRLARFGTRPIDPVHIWAGRLRPDDLNQVRQYIVDHRIALVLLDTLSRFWIGKVTDENNNAEVASVTDLLLTLARETGACVVLVHHDRKSGGREGASIRGAGDLLGVVDQALLLSKRGKEYPQNHRVLRIIGRYQEDSPSQIVLVLEGDRYEPVGSPDSVVEQSPDEESPIWAALSLPMSDAELEAKTGLARARVRAGRAALGAKLVRSGRGVKGDPFLYQRLSQEANHGTGSASPAA